jgi:DNA-directed RNA polymerase specialized sigma24 family protein
MSMQNLNGKHVVITGGSQGLGLAMVEAPAACGANVTAIARDRANGEDIVQDALIKAPAARPNVDVIDNPEGWVFRIAHNTALDFMRRRARGRCVQKPPVLTIHFPESYEILSHVQNHSGARRSR